MLHNEIELEIPIYNDVLIIQDQPIGAPEEFMNPSATGGWWRGKDDALHLWLSNKSNPYRTIPHECVHIANHILYERRVVYYPNEDETLAYLVGFLSEHAFSAYQKFYSAKKEEPAA